MTIRERCAICDCDRDGNVWPESANVLCDAHWIASCFRSLVQAGALTDFKRNAWGKAPNHAGMLLTRDEREAEKRHAWRAPVASLCNTLTDRYGFPVWWDDGTDDATDSEGDKYTLMTGLLAAWVIDEIEKAARDRKRRAA